jgi:DNA-directed RNA polymerase subunit E'/Rpb7
MSSISLVSPITNTLLSTRVSLLPHQMNNDIYYNLKYNTERKVQGKCNEEGYVIKVLKIEDYSDGDIEGENFTGSAVYKIRYLASLCTPIENTQIITKIENVSNVLLTNHGPISCVITPDRVNTKLFTNEMGKYYYKSDSNKNSAKIELIKGTLVKVTILSKQLYKGDRMISLGFLDEIATQGEIDNYYKPELFNLDHEEVETNDLVEFHEDDIDTNANVKNNEFLI